MGFTQHIGLRSVLPELLAEGVILSMGLQGLMPEITSPFPLPLLPPQEDV